MAYLFCVNTTVLANQDILAPIAGNSEVYQVMRKTMEKRSAVTEAVETLRQLRVEIDKNMGRLPVEAKGRALMFISESDEQAVSSTILITPEREKHIERALEYVKKDIWAKRKVTEENILEIHRILESTKRKPLYRRQDVAPIVYETDESGERRLSLQQGIMFTPFNDIPEEMSRFIKFFNSALNNRNDDVDPITVAAEAYKKFITIHPFDNFNARTAGILCTYYLARHGYPGFQAGHIERGGQKAVEDLAVIFARMILATSTELVARMDVLQPVKKEITAFEKEWEASELSTGRFTSALSRILGLEAALDHNKPIFVFSEKVTFDNSLAKCLPKLAEKGVKVAVIVKTDRERALIDKLNEGKAKDKKIIQADTIDGIRIAAARAKVLAPRFYYFRIKDSTDPMFDGRNVTVYELTSDMVKRIIDAIGTACRIEHKKLPVLHEMAHKFAEAA